MNVIPDLSLLEAPRSVAVAELQAAGAGEPRGGPLWDPFRALPEVRLSRAAQDELLGVLSEARAKAADAEAKLSRARSDRTRGQHSRTVYRLSQVCSWAREALLASVSLLLVKRVDIALKRHQRSMADSADEYMAEALSCALDCLQSIPEGVRFHLYVASAVDAVLSAKALQGSVAETMPQAWQVALRHLPSITSDLATELGRRPSDREVGEALLARSRKWAEARIVEKGGEVEPDILDELVDAKLTKQGMFSAVRHIGEIRAAAAGAVSIDADWGVDVLAGHCSPGADVIAEEESSESVLRALLDPIPFVSPALEVEAGKHDQVRELLESELWHTLALEGPLPVEEVRVSRKAPDFISRLVA